MNIEKTGLLTLVAVLALGLSASPIFQNYVAYAQTDDDPPTNLDEMDFFFGEKIPFKVVVHQLM